MTMLEIVQEDVGKGGETPLKIGIVVKTGLDEEQIVEIAVGQPISEVLVVVAAVRGCAVEELILLREGEVEPVPGGSVVGHDYPHHHRHHVHHIHDLEVLVHYQADTHRRAFKRFQTVEEVLDWAIPAFGIDPTMAPEFELARHGVTEELPLKEHLGHIARHHAHVELDLNRSEMPNG